jgi:spermidine/putrescine transport system substrate-binding protein
MQSLHRRRLLQGAAATAGAALASPFLARRAFAQDGRTVNIFAWAGYLNDDLLAKFTADTGINAVYTPYGTNDELLNQMRANNGGGFDLIWPSVDRVPNYVEFGLVQPIDEGRVQIAQVLPSAWDSSTTLGAVVDGARYQVPTDWGTEALSFDRDQMPLEFGTASYGDIWGEAAAGKATVRGHSALIGLGLWMQAEGRLPRPLMDAFSDPDAQVEIFDVIVAEAIARKGNVIQFWSNENEAQGAFRLNGAAIGQTWDSTAAALAREGLPIGYIAPKEGALAWMEGLCMPVGAENIDEAYEFINWFLTPEVGAMYTNATQYNSTAVGSDQFLSEEAKAFFAAAYPGDALQNLWWWPIQESWYITKRNEYQDRFLSA